MINNDIIMMNEGEGGRSNPYRVFEAQNNLL